MIASLEDEVGFPLLIRSHRGVVPTVDCQRLLPAAEGLVLPAQDEMFQCCDGIRHNMEHLKEI